MNRNFNINNELLKSARDYFSTKNYIYWIIGGAGSGKSTISKYLSQTLNLLVYDMDEYIYGKYHSRFVKEKHPVSYQWSHSENGLLWLLSMSWNEFNNFNQASLPEYLDLLKEDLSQNYKNETILIDGGICNPGVLVEMFPAKQILCFENPFASSIDIWEKDNERKVMKDIILNLPEGEEKWNRFLEFDEKITANIINESNAHRITIYKRNANERIFETAEKVADILNINVFK